jgi:hypothetical protein
VGELLSETYGVMAAEPDAVADCLSAAARMPVERHRSVYYGDYSLCRGSGRGKVRVCHNRDPMYIPGKHPPEDRFLRPELPADWILVEAYLDEDELERLRKALRACFPDAVLLHSGQST